MRLVTRRHTPMNAHRQRRDGFTLLELVVVVAILSILTAIVMPSSGMSEKRKLDTLQVEIQDAIDHAQSLAYHKGYPYGVKFHVNKNWFAVCNQVGTPVDDPLTHGDYVIRIEEPGQPKDIHIDQASFTSIEDGQTRPLIAFNEKGVMETPGEVRIRAGNSSRRLLINTATAKLFEVPMSSP